MAQPLQQLGQFDQIHSTEQCAPSGQPHHRVFGHDVRPTGRNRHQMLAFFVEVHSVLAPRMEIVNEFELLAGPWMKGMGDAETSIQTVCIRRT
jgi:hypothetical protein